MIEVITWNVQGGRGADGVYSLERLANVVFEVGGADVICLQEIARHAPDVDGGRGIDQVAELGRLFRSYESVFGPAVDRMGQERGGHRQRFGNLILSRLPVLQAFRHPLPQPADPDVAHMPRQATEVVVDTGAGMLRIITTHLEFHSEAQRIAQVSRLRALHEEACQNASQPGRDAGALYARVARPASAIYCGDYNFGPDSAPYAHMLSTFPPGTVPLEDAWTVCQGGRPHAPTCGVFDHQQWPEGAHCRDYFFITADLAPHADALTVALDTNASDHQPVRLTLGDF